MMKQEALQPGFHGFTELVILKVLQAHKDQEKDVVRAAEACAATMAGVLPTEMVVRVLNPIVKTGDFPVNQVTDQTIYTDTNWNSPLFTLLTQHYQHTLHTHSTHSQHTQHTLHLQHLQAAIKMLTKLVEQQTPDSIDSHLGELMPGLLKVISDHFINYDDTTIFWRHKTVGSLGQY